MYYQNVRGLRTKTAIFRRNVESSSPDIIALTETFLNSSVSDGELFPPEYCVLRKDRVGDVGWGGVLLAVKSTYTVSIVNDIDGLSDDKEVLFVRVRSKKESFLICVVYLPPNYTECQYLDVLDCIENAACKYCTCNVIIVGDFNLNSFNSHVVDQFENFTQVCKLRQCNFVNNAHGGVLDLVLTNVSADDTHIWKCEDSLVPMDAYHPPLEIAFNFSRNGRVADQSSQSQCESVPQSLRWNFRKADLFALYSDLSSIDWSCLYRQKDVNEAVNVFYEVVNSSLDRNVPLRKCSTDGPRRYNYPSWYTPEIIRYIKLKHFNLVKFKRYGLEFNRELFRYYRNLVKELIGSANREHIRSIQRKIHLDPKQFWRHVEDKRGSRRPKDTFTLDNVRVSNQVAVDAFAEHFSSVFHTRVPLLDAEHAERAACGGLDASCINLSQVSLGELRRVVRRLKVNSSPGPDGIPAFLLKDCLPVLEEPLLFVFNLALSERIYPSLWKVSRVTPVPKDASSMEIDTFRPIAILSVFAKVFEGVINRHITPLISRRLTDVQHGFRAGRSTTTNNVNFADYVLQHMDSAHQVDAAFFDFKKAFDLVDNDILLRKLSGFGFSRDLLEFFASYLKDRRQFVQMAGYQSKEYFTRSGVSQGSTLGPTQFLIMINDLPAVINHVQCLLFADDLKIFFAINSVSDCYSLQCDINAVLNWSLENRLLFNASKCKVITFSRSKTLIEGAYHLDDQSIDRVQAIRDLGLNLDSRLDFHDHIGAVVKSANKTLGFIMRTASQFQGSTVPVILFNAFVRSKLEFNSIIWDPSESIYQLLIERVQRKFARYLYKREFGYYPYLYPSLFVSGMVGLETLKFRRKMHLLVHYCLLLRSEVDNPQALERMRLFVPEQYTRAGRRRRQLLAAPAPTRTRRARNAPSARAVSLLNHFVAQDQDADVFADGWHSLLRRMYVFCNLFC